MNYSYFSPFIRELLRNRATSKAIFLLSVVMICFQLSPALCEADFSGSWSGTYASTSGGTSGNVSGNITQTGTTLTGTLSVTNTACGNFSNLSLTGSVSGNVASFQMSTTCPLDGSYDQLQYTNGILSGNTMNGNYAVYRDGAWNDSGTFALSRATTNYILSVSKTGSGTGTVTSSPSGINCGSACSASYTAGTSVMLTATANTGSTFAGWSGGSCSGTGTCTVTMNSAQSFTATFNTSSKILTNSVSTRSTVKITDMSGTLPSAGGAITVNAWDATGNSIPASGSAVPLKLYSHATTTIMSADLATRFPSGTPQSFEFTVQSPKVIVTNAKSSTDGSLNFPIMYTSGLTNFATNCVGPLSTVSITDMSGTLSPSDVTITVNAWDVNGNAITQSASATPLILYSHGTTSIAGAALAARFQGTPMTYEFIVNSSRAVITNSKNNTSGTLTVPIVFTIGGDGGM